MKLANYKTIHGWLLIDARTFKHVILNECSRWINTFKDHLLNYVLNRLNVSKFLIPFYFTSATNVNDFAHKFPAPLQKQKQQLFRSKSYSKCDGNTHIHRHLQHLIDWLILIGRYRNWKNLSSTRRKYYRSYLTGMIQTHYYAF